ncbi:ABC transporter ATP-binding protein [Archaeoglobus veneficus]|uniref:Phosphonate-transporting ATPase n=1 Tax=Archaeoglobus veneficus (strain DSM 11195 / SNP6) TaxID=693661 RepID=F2KSP3_ARCVS|nr:ABC transporter ATP-binding protein [Archaeoglobus veneficus]AEA48113.1 Phosphonate-transporting ATPase [Archaeoglobus veneficus SNP6]
MVVLKANGLKKRYGNFEALKGVSFELDSGEILGLIGENGAGKSTIIKILTGLIEPTDGKVEYFGRDFGEFKEVKNDIGYLPEVDSLYENMNALEYLSFFASIYGVKDKRRIDELLEMLKIPANKPLGEFSKGMKRKVAIARTLIHDPQILIYDEPTGGLDPSTSLFIANFMRELKKKGKAILFSAHNMYYVESVCDKVLILKSGEALYYGPIDELKAGKKYVVHYRENGREDRFVTDDIKELNEFIQGLTASGGRIVNIYSEAMRLEDVYFALVS